MAALGKIRSKGVLLICIIGLGLFSFIAGDLWKSLEQLFNSERTQAGKVVGTKLGVQDFQDIVNDWTEVAKMVNNSDNLPAEMTSQLQDWAWNDFVNSKTMTKEFDELGIIVTDDELKNLLESTDEATQAKMSQYLYQVYGGNLFVNPQTGRFEYASVQQLLDAANKAKTVQEKEFYGRYKKAWMFVEKHLVDVIRSSKYQSLFRACFLSNPVEAKANYDAKTQVAAVDVVAFPFAKQEEPKVTDEELKAKYNEMKNQFRQYQEERMVKFVDFTVTASAEDIAALQAKFEGYKTTLDSLHTTGEYLTEFGTDIKCLGLPVTKKALADNHTAADLLDSLAVGQTSSVFESVNAQTGARTKNVMKLLSKEAMPDSIQYRALIVKAESSDSVYTALKASASIDSIAKKYNQPADSMWMTVAQYESAPSVPTYYKDFVSALFSTTSGDVAVVKNYNGQGDLVIKVLNKKFNSAEESHTKYTYALVSEDIMFSDATYNAEYNRFSSFVSKTQTIDALVKNAEAAGYQVRDIAMNTSMHGIPMGMNPYSRQMQYIGSTIDAQRWVFDDDTKEGQVSSMYACGNNDEFVVVALDKIVEEGYAPLDVQAVKDQVKAEVIKDKRAKAILEKIKGVNSVEGAVAKGGEKFTVEHITTGAGAITVGSAREKAISGAIIATAKGSFSAKPFVGDNGVYVFKVTDKSKNQNIAYDEKAEKKEVAGKMTSYVGSYVNQLYNNAKVVDNRYKFFQ